MEEYHIYSDDEDDPPVIDGSAQILSPEYQPLEEEYDDDDDELDERFEQAVSAAIGLVGTGVFRGVRLSVPQNALPINAQHRSLIPGVYGRAPRSAIPEAHHSMLDNEYEGLAHATRESFDTYNEYVRRQESRHAEERARRAQESAAAAAAATTVTSSASAEQLPRRSKRLARKPVIRINKQPRLSTSSTEEASDTCFICLDTLKNVHQRGALIPCGCARFHVECARDTFVKCGRCPLKCGETLSGYMVIKM